MARKWLGMKGVLIGALTLCALSGTVPGAFARDSTAPGTNAQRQGGIAVAQLPREAVNTLNLIDAGGPYPYEKDGIVFGNRERLLPAHRRGYYHEYTVPTPRSRNRGARRIVCGGPLRRTDNCYYSDDHYTTFNRIVE
ncbi:ribonuclease [Paraburkholderia terricola]|uniref:Ribonuclease T1 n=1 Tax=Paraburkholderia terricola TaxID=169427 RepID=A0ABU1LRN9_9BURK|nr:ribonuclease [Paraburkholderia terricola]MDR6409405.1 ribonuclease T1 [Paraburkholderia terricola]MDR6483838.1 ribonuclease T1 [Paraburkholderia terricola]